MNKDNKYQYSLWSCGPWPRKLLEQVLRNASITAYIDGRTSPVYPRHPFMNLSLIHLLTKKEYQRWVTTLTKRNVAFQLTRRAVDEYCVSENPTGFYSSFGEEARDKYGRLSVIA